MLKWAVNTPRQTYLQNKNDASIELIVSSDSSAQQNQKSDLNSLRSETSWVDKENQNTSTPLHSANRSFLKCPLRTVDSFRDISYIVPESASNFSLKLPTDKVSPKTLKSPECTQTWKTLHNNYASTLPTLEVEYSPCSLIPGPLLALRGVGIPDSYFEKPRYIISHPREVVSNVNEELSLETKTLQQPIGPFLKYPTYMDESTLSSSKMGDVTLERMIDAILESNRKQNKSNKTQKHRDYQNLNMSSSYTPAEDPANDLYEVWDSEKSRYRQREQKFRARLPKKNLFNENEVRSPYLTGTLDPSQLRRRGGLRRKRKISQITANVMSSAQKLLRKDTQAQAIYTHSHNLCQVFKAEFKCDEVQPRKPLRNISPDSGHNSSSDYEDVKECTSDNNKTLDHTKGRLNLSLQDLGKI